MIRLIIVDDHEMIRKGLQSLLSTEADLSIAALLNTGEAAIDHCAEHAVDIVLMDLLMPGMGGVEATKRIREICPSTQIIAVTINDEARSVVEAIKAGATGYILKHSSKEEILKAIREVAMGKAYFSPEASKALTEGLHPNIEPKNHSITKKEGEVLALIAQERTNQEMADELGCSLRTIDTHKRNLVRKLGVRNMVGLIKYAVQHYKE